MKTARSGVRGVAVLSSRRQLSAYSFSDDRDQDHWPRSGHNTVINTVPQGEVVIVERFGKLHAVQGSGLFFAIPLVDRLKYRIDTREQVLEIPPLSAITKDNVSVRVSALVFCQFVDYEKAAYGSMQPLSSVRQHASACLRGSFGTFEERE